MMTSTWIITTAPTTCLSCRKPIPAASRAYSLTGSEDTVYCERCGPRAEAAMQQNAEHKARERRIIAGLPV